MLIMLAFDRRFANLSTVALGLIGLVGLVGLGCTALELDDLENGECPNDEKACQEQCVSADDPAFGCATPSCSPCSLPNAVATCDALGACAVASCSGAFQDCDGDPLNGCEIDVAHDPQSCGSCDAPPCSFPQAVAGCRAGLCSIRTCKPGWDDCNGELDDGCEVELTTPEHCGRCDERCDRGQTCVDGTCVGA